MLTKVLSHFHERLEHLLIVIALHLSGILQCAAHTYANFGFHPDQIARGDLDAMEERGLECCQRGAPEDARWC